VLRHLTFYTLNRIYLVIAILFSTIYPNINLSDFAQRHQQYTQPVQNAISSWKAPAENFVKPLYQPDYWQWVELVFWTGAALFAIRLIMQLLSLRKLYRNSEPGQLHNYSVRLISDNISPFSFWRSIYINPASLSPAELKSVLEHEQVHVNQWHTLDVLLAELSTVFYWFNPGVWLMKKAVRENIEFITDRKILQKGMDSKQYQYSLVSVSLATTPNTIVNHFNISTIKKRIIMMNAKRSSGYNLTRYVFLVPAVVALLLIFSFSKAAVSKKSMHTIKAITTAITNARLINFDKPVVAHVKKNAAAPVIKIKPANADTIYVGKSKSKDGKNKSFTLIGNANPDSVNYVINGVKATRADLKAMDPARIYSLDMMPAEKAKEFFPELSNTQRVLFVTTDDSETGKKLKEKIDKTMGGGMLARARSMTVTANGISSDHDPVVVSANSYSISGSSNEAPMAVGSNDDVTSVVVVGDPKIAANAMVKNKVYVTGSPKTSFILKENGDAPDVVYFDSEDGDKTVLKSKVYSFQKSSPKFRVNGFVSNNGSSINNFGDKLIVIDGKVASEKQMKNLKITDIKSLTEKVDDATKEKYGDKAKNGVLFITTKK
jgi:hypothetical protein